MRHGIRRTSKKLFFQRTCSPLAGLVAVDTACTEDTICLHTETSDYLADAQQKFQLQIDAFKTLDRCLLHLERLQKIPVQRLSALRRNKGRPFPVLSFLGTTGCAYLDADFVCNEEKDKLPTA